MSEKKSADEAGYAVKQTVIDNSPMDSSWKHKTPRGVVSDLTELSDAKAIAEDERMRENHRKIKAIMEEGEPERPQQRMPFAQQAAGGISMGDLMEGLDTKDLAAIAAGAEDMAQGVAVDMVQRGYRGDGDEASLLAESMGRQPAQSAGTWGLSKMGAKLKGTDKVVPVWKVVDEETKMELPTPYRIQAPAERIVAILNTNNGAVKDPRIVRINEAYKTHLHLMKNIRSCQKLINEGQVEYKGKVAELREELEAVNVILGI